MAMFRKSTFAILTLGLFAGCQGIAPHVGGDEKDELVGAGGRDLTEYWPDIDVPHSQNTKLLSFDMMKNEVMRATGQSWDSWAANASVLGAANWSTIWTEDRTPNQQKIVTLRKMALAVCQSVVDAEAGQATRSVFTEVDPASTIDPTAAITRTQVVKLFERVFMESPSEADITESLQALGDLQAIAPGGGPRQAWRGLCASYLASMRFLSY